LRAVGETFGARKRVGFDERDLPARLLMGRGAKAIVVAGLGLAVAACGSTPGDRAASGAAIGAGVGVIGGAIFGQPAAGALLGAAAGAGVGALTKPGQLDFGKPPWR
jgi:hypothetical protein